MLTAAARVEPVLDPRSDWFVRRLTEHPGDTLPELSRAGRWLGATARGRCR